jgi:ABC-type branched-subunit amino acid transport system ATPase component
MTPVFELRKVSKHYGPVRALEEVDFGIWPDEVQAVVGDNGAGKSTLVKIISGAHRHDGGAIFGRLAAPLWGSSCVSLQSAASGGAIGGRQRGSERAPLGLRRCPPRP